MNNKKLYLAVLINLMFLNRLEAAKTEFSPPSYSSLNRHSVNMATGQLQMSLVDVQIGGDLGLTHKLSSYGSEFANYLGERFYGFQDNYRGGVYSVIRYKPNNESASYDSNW